MEIRTLAAGEREAVLELLDGWAVGDGWRGRDFFRRYIEFDPTFRDENFWVAVEAGRLVSCAQIFPRALGVGGATLALGGIGSVFTRADQREAGVASLVMRHAEAAMRARGMVLGMLFAGPAPWYERRGWLRWPFARAVYLREGGLSPPPEELELAAFESDRDLDAVKAIHAHYSGRRDATVARDDADWEGSLHLAGNPDEDFRVARRAGSPVAYARTIRLEGHPVLAEFGRREGAAADLAALLAVMCARAGAFGPAPADRELEAALAARRIQVRPLGDPSSMLRCLDREALCAATGVERVAGESDADLLRRILPPERVLFWPADRF